MKRTKGGFTLVELLTVVGIVGVLLGVLIPVLGSVRSRARSLRSVQQQRSIVMACSLYAADQDERYPDSIAILRYADDRWHWQDPRMITATQPRPRRRTRSMATYLRGYLPEAEVLYCPKAPSRYPHLQAAWEQGDAWDHPDTLFASDPVYGSYCFFWNYVGFLEQSKQPFVGPRTTLAGRRQSTLLVSDYLGTRIIDKRDIGLARDDDADGQDVTIYGSCEPFKGAEIVRGTEVSSDYWATPLNATAPRRLQTVAWQAGFTDGHVESFGVLDTVRMDVATEPDGTEAYPEDVDYSPGGFFLPRRGIHALPR